MKLVLHILFLQVVFGVRVVKSLQEVFGDPGGSITLRSGANWEWNLSTIEWSIFKNNTWIATYRDGEQNIDRVYRYKGRLSLNTKTGDLTIHNLTIQDSMEFNVDFISTDGKDDSTKIKLTVKKRLQQPTIQTLSRTSMKDGCWIILNCSSEEEGVSFSWKITPSRVTVINQTYDNSAVLLVSLDNTTTQAKATCISSINPRNSSKDVSLECDSIKLAQQGRCYDASLFCVGFFVGFIPTLVLLCLCKEKIKEAWDYIKEKCANEKRVLDPVEP